MDAKRRTQGAFTALFGFVSGYLLAKARSAAELRTYRQIIRDHQHTNITYMEARRSKRNDQET